MQPVVNCLNYLQFFSVLHLCKRWPSNLVKTRAWISVTMLISRMFNLRRGQLIVQNCERTRPSYLASLLADFWLVILFCTLDLTLYYCAHESILLYVSMVAVCCHRKCSLLIQSIVVIGLRIRVLQSASSRPERFYVCLDKIWVL